MRTELLTKWNVPSTYAEDYMGMNGMVEKYSFAYVPGEIYKADRRYNVSIDETENLNMTPLEEEILARVALSKYLTERQIVEFMQLQGMCTGAEIVEQTLLQMERKRILRRHKMFIANERDTLIYYGINFWGMIKVTQYMEIEMHKGISWYPNKDREKRGLREERASDVKCLLVGNEIVLNMLKNKVPMVRFGFMEAFRAISEREEVPRFCPTLNIQFDEENIVAFDVVRDYSSPNVSSYRALSYRMHRFYQMVRDQEYLTSNYHGYKAFPKIVICGENLQHNRKIKRYLREHQLWNRRDVKILFTEDALVMNGKSQFIYEIDENDKVVWQDISLTLE